MKIFSNEKYSYEGIFSSPVDGRNYFAFKCIKKDFSPETVFVTEAKLVGNDGFKRYFNSNELKSLNRA